MHVEMKIIRLTEHKAKGRVKESSTISVDRSGDGQIGGHLSKRTHEAEDHGADQGVGDLRGAGSCNSNRRATGQEESSADGSTY